jgi:hypothetical protein
VLEKLLKKKGAPAGKDDGPEPQRPPQDDGDRPIEIDEHEAFLASAIMTRAEAAVAGRLREVVGRLATACACLACALAVVFYFGIVRHRDYYFAADEHGNIQPMIPLSEPYVSATGLLGWTVRSICETYSLDFNNYQKVLGAASDSYTPKAWKELQEQIRPMIESVAAKNLVLVAVATEAPRILNEGMVDAVHYGWKVEFPVVIRQYGAERSENYHWLVQVLVTRADVHLKSSGLEIAQFVIRPK